MKKMLSVLLCVMLLTGCGAASAEDKTDLVSINIHGAFALRGRIPEGYKFTLTESDNLFIRGRIASEDPAKPVMQLSVAFDESYADVERMNELSDGDLAVLEETFRADSTVEISYSQTSLGTKLMVVREVGSDRDYVDFFSIYKGHSIDLVLVAGPGAEDPSLSREQIEMSIAFLSDLDFVPAE